MTLFRPLVTILKFTQKCKQTAVSQKLSKIKKNFQNIFLHLMRCLNFWQSFIFWGAKFGPLTHATAVKCIIWIYLWLFCIEKSPNITWQKWRKFSSLLQSIHISTVQYKLCHKKKIKWRTWNMKHRAASWKSQWEKITQQEKNNSTRKI